MVAPARDPTAGRQWTRGEGQVEAAAWSPDGKRIVILTATVRDPIQYSIRTGENHLWILDGHSDPIRLTTGASLAPMRPLWLADGIWAIRRDLAGGTPETVILRITPR